MIGRREGEDHRSEQEIGQALGEAGRRPGSMAGRTASRATGTGADHHVLGRHRTPGGTGSGGPDRHPRWSGSTSSRPLGSTAASGTERWRIVPVARPGTGTGNPGSPPGPGFPGITSRGGRAPPNGTGQAARRLATPGSPVAPLLGTPPGTTRPLAHRPGGGSRGTAYAPALAAGADGPCHRNPRMGSDRGADATARRPDRETRTGHSRISLPRSACGDTPVAGCHRTDPGRPCPGIGEHRGARENHLAGFP